MAGIDAARRDRSRDAEGGSGSDGSAPYSRASGPRRPNAFSGGVLVERGHGARDLRLDLARVAAGRLVEDPRGGDGTPHALEPDSVQQQLAGTTSVCGDAQRLELLLGREPRDPGGCGERGDEGGQPARQARVQEIAGDDRVRRVGSASSAARQASTGSPSFDHRRASPR